MVSVNFKRNPNLVPHLKVVLVAKISMRGVAITNNLVVLQGVTSQR